MNKRKRTAGEAYRKLDAAMEHISHAWYVLMQQTGHPEMSQQQPATNGLKPGTAEYHTAAVFNYAREAWQVLAENVPTDWQLCPYQDCCWGCGIDQEGWYICPHCRRPFYATWSDSDYEDVNLRRLDQREDKPPEIDILLADDFGPSWATPESET